MLAVEAFDERWARLPPSFLPSFLSVCLVIRPDAMHIQPSLLAATNRRTRAASTEIQATHEQRARRGNGDAKD